MYIVSSNSPLLFIFMLRIFLNTDAALTVDSSHEATERYIQWFKGNTKLPSTCDQNCSWAERYLLLLIDVDCKLFPMGKCKHGDTCLFKHATPTLNIDRVTVETFYRPQPQPPPPSLNDALHRNEGSSFPSSLLIFRCFLRNQPLLKLSVLTCRSSVSIFNGNNDMHEPRNVPCPWFPFPFFTI